jgi:hypothetical protein
MSDETAFGLWIDPRLEPLVVPRSDRCVHVFGIVPRGV